MVKEVIDNAIDVTACVQRIALPEATAAVKIAVVRGNLLPWGFWAFMITVLANPKPEGHRAIHFYGFGAALNLKRH